MVKNPNEINDSHLFKLIWNYKGPNWFCSFPNKVARGRFMTHEKGHKVSVIMVVNSLV
jgi:hypothetical protein